MAIEREHKYLVTGENYRIMAGHSVEISQGYLSRVPERTVRVRTVDRQAFITIKGITRGDFRHEYEYEIPYADAKELLGMCEPPVISKRRHYVDWDGHTWEVDEFGGDLSPLVTAEIELQTEGESYEIPPFVGRDVTDNPAFFNSNLSTGEWRSFIG